MDSAYNFLMIISYNISYYILILQHFLHCVHTYGDEAEFVFIRVDLDANTKQLGAATG